MLKHARRFNVRRLFVLGAGASYGACYKKGLERSFKVAPLDKDFCEIIERLSTQRPAWVKKTKKSILQRWKDHRPFNEFGLEAAIICQLGHLEFIKSIHPRRKNEYSALEFLNEMAHLISYILAKAEVNQKSKLYERLHKLVMTGHETDISGFRDRIITFNYDTLFDQHFLSQFSIQELYFDKLAPSKPTKKFKRKKRHDHPILLKLHGSTNWTCEQDEFEKMLLVSGEANPYYVEKVWLAQNGTLISPDDSEAPLIIPPLPNKPLTKIEIFKYLWTKAAEYLSRADELVICGYSLPNTDSLAGSLFGSFENKSLTSITIIDPSPEILMKWKKLLSRSGVSTKSWAYFSDLNEFLESKGL